MNPNQPYPNTNHIPGEFDVSMASNKGSLDVSMSTTSSDVSMDVTSSEMSMSIVSSNVDKKTPNLDVSMAKPSQAKPYIPPWLKNTKHKPTRPHNNTKSPLINSPINTPATIDNVVTNLVSVPPIHQNQTPPGPNPNMPPPPQVSPEIVIVPESNVSPSLCGLPTKKQRLQDNIKVPIPTAQKRKMDNTSRNNNNNDNVIGNGDDEGLGSVPKKRHLGNEREPVVQPQEVDTPRTHQVFHLQFSQEESQTSPRKWNHQTPRENEAKGEEGKSRSNLSISSESVVPSSEFRHSESQVFPDSFQMSMGESQTSQLPQLFTTPPPPPPPTSQSPQSSSPSQELRQTPLGQQQQQQTQPRQQRNYFELSNSNMKLFQRYNTSINTILYYVLVACYVTFIIWLILGA